MIVGLLIAVVALVWVAERTKVPYPMLLMVGGLGLAILPWTPTIELDPEIVLVIFLPPILFQAAQTTSFRDFKANFRPISRLAVGLVVVTTALVALVVHWVVPGVGWPAAFVLGAIVSPPDAVAATAIFQRLGAPKRIVTILEGESLINDASAIVVYTFAVSAVVTGEFSFPNALLEFVIVVVVGVLVGGVVGWLLGRILTILGDPSLSLIAVLIAPALTYLLAERLGGSGVLAVVTAGLVHGYESPRTMTASVRIRSLAVWDLVTIVVNGLVFFLIGAELAVLRELFPADQVPSILLHAAAVLAAMIVARFFYVFASSINPGGRRSRRGDLEDSRYQFVIAWSGLRGVVSLATALALPLVTNSGAPFDHRNEIILVTAIVIVATLFGFGLPLPWILRKLRFASDDGYAKEMQLAKRVVHQAMYEQMRQAFENMPELEPELRPMLKEMQSRFERFTSMPEQSAATQIQDVMRPRILNREKAIQAARNALLELRDQGEISDEVRREVERKLDLQELELSV